LSYIRLEKLKILFFAGVGYTAVLIFHEGRGSDYVIYSQYWKSPTDEFELGFKILATYFGTFIISYETFRAFSLALLYYTFSKIVSQPKREHLVFSSFALLMLFDDYGLTRQILAISLLLVALYSHKWIFLIIGATVHISIIIFLPILALRKIRRLRCFLTYFLGTFLLMIALISLDWMGSQIQDPTGLLMRINVYLNWDVGFLHGYWFYTGLTKQLLYLAIVTRILMKGEISGMSPIDSVLTNIYLGGSAIYLASISFAPAIAARYSLLITLLFFIILFRSRCGKAILSPTTMLCLGMECFALLLNLNF
jgi:hypothetical protein